MTRFLTLTFVYPIKLMGFWGLGLHISNKDVNKVSYVVQSLYVKGPFRHFIQPLHNHDFCWFAVV